MFRNLIENTQIDKTFVELYKPFNNDDLELLFSSFHAQLTALLESMNEKLPTGNFYNYYPAQKSRDLIFLIEKIEKLHTLKIEFKTDEYYSNIIEYLKKILKPKAGSSILPNTKVIELYYDKPIFIKK